jgi:hypothetical protein
MVRLLFFVMLAGFNGDGAMIRCLIPVQFHINQNHMVRLICNYTAEIKSAWKGDFNSLFCRAVTEAYEEIQWEDS